MSKFLFLVTACFFSLSTLLQGSEFTISSYNCGGLSNHYDYLRAAVMQKLMQERYNSEPETMALNEKIQKVALKILLGKEGSQVNAAKQYWLNDNFDSELKNLIAQPETTGSLNNPWNAKNGSMISTYKIRPVEIRDEEVYQMLNDHIADTTQGKVGDFEELLTETRAIMAKRIFHRHLKYDILCLQEADYLHPDMFPDTYEGAFVETPHSVNGIFWNKERFDLVRTLGNIVDRAFAVQLLDKETGKTILVASAHLTGCNPFQVVFDTKANSADSDKGDSELRIVIDLFEQIDADIKLIAMDSNVTAIHPRLGILKQCGYGVDTENFLEPTCTNPHMVLDTRIDWIALQANGTTSARVANIPVQGVGLNNIQTNISDHKPIAAKVYY